MCEILTRVIVSAAFASTVVELVCWYSTALQQEGKFLLTGPKMQASYAHKLCNKFAQTDAHTHAGPSPGG